MAYNKQKFALWLTPSTKEKVEVLYREDDCRSQSEFIEKAIEFYAGYLYTLKAGAFLPRVLGNVIDGKFAVFGKKIGRLLFKLSVESNVTNHILASDTDIDRPTYDRLHNRSVREVRETNGEITFLDDLNFQKSV